MFATHWDGYPASLGRDLLKCDKSLGEVIELAKDHKIDTADRSILRELNGQSEQVFAKRNHLREIRVGKMRTSMFCAGERLIGDLKDYGDWADYQYDIRGKKVYFRRLRGQWIDGPESAGEFRVLTGDEAGGGS